jgi:tetratricopeptide (TPR) repeat protein
MSRYIKIITAYLLAAFFVTQLFGLRDEYVQAKIKNVNLFPPNSFDEMVTLFDDNSKRGSGRMDDYLKYAQDVLRFEPQRADAWGLSGLCFALKEDYRRAIFSYLKASALEPEFFGFHYNLAYLYYKTKQYELSLSHIQSALRSDPAASMDYIHTSGKIYDSMVSARKENGVMPEDQLKQAYQKVNELFAVVQYRLNMGLTYPGEEQFTLEFY